MGEKKGFDGEMDFDIKFPRPIEIKLKDGKISDKDARRLEAYCVQDMLQINPKYLSWYYYAVDFPGVHDRYGFSCTSDNFQEDYPVALNALDAVQQVLSALNKKGTAVPKEISITIRTGGAD
ncbi:MAG TPA: hypothetical protein VLH19_04555 [Patescibacteria group bacterium]|nr:hypothetical protein [Patescibacteria group bacterium]